MESIKFVVQFALSIKMKCKHCSHTILVKRGRLGCKQRFQCCLCKKYQQDIYTYKRYNEKDDKIIKMLNAEGVGIRSMSRILGYSNGTITRRILKMAEGVTKPIYHQDNQIYEVDEMWTYIGSNIPSNYCWITYAINRSTGEIIDVAIGSRSKRNLEIVINKLKSLSPKKIVTDKLNTYPNLVSPVAHDTSQYANNRIERMNLTIRTNLKRLSRKTICFSRSRKVLEACVLLFFDYHYWNLRMG